MMQNLLLLVLKHGGSTYNFRKFTYFLMELFFGPIAILFHIKFSSIMHGMRYWVQSLISHNFLPCFPYFFDSVQFELITAHFSGLWKKKIFKFLQHVPRINGEIPSFDEATSDHQRLIDRYGFCLVQLCLEKPLQYSYCSTF